jgi:hypothetical protein
MHGIAEGETAIPRPQGDARQGPRQAKGRAFTGTNSITISKIFTDAEIERARKLLNECERRPPGLLHKRIVTEIVKPAMPRINKATGQENDADYIGYLLEAVLTNVLPSISCDQKQRDALSSLLKND